MQRLQGKKGVILTVADERSIGYHCARVMTNQGANLLMTHRTERSKETVSSLAQRIDAACMPCDINEPEDLDALLKALKQRWGHIDFIVHSLAFAKPRELSGRLIDTSTSGFDLAMNTSCHSLMRLVKVLEPVLSENASVIAMSFYGAEKVVENYGVMGPIKAALEASIRYMAAELGPKGVRVNGVSPGWIETRAAHGIQGFDQHVETAKNLAPLGRLVTGDEVGEVTGFLASDASSGMTGQILRVDAGQSIIGF